MYGYEQLVKDLNIGREIEFSYKNKHYAITRTSKGWQFSCDNQLIEGYYKNTNELIEAIENNIKIQDTDLKDLFNLEKYDSDSLYIL